MIMTSSVNGTSLNPPMRRSKRILRQATLILPKTGERVRRAVTFCDLDGANGDERVNERAPLLGRRGSGRSGSNGPAGILESWKSLIQQAWTFANSRTGRGVFKCSVAYFLGSLATFMPFFTKILGQQFGKHIVATITVYFHPARSKGSMCEAVICATLAFVYAAFICFTSMGVSVLFGQTFDLIIVGHVIVLIVFCGGGLGFVGWVKQRLDNPLVNIACSLTSLAIITVLTKEGAVQAAKFSDDKIQQVMLMIILGVFITTVVSFTISPVSARRDLRENMGQVTDSFADMLTVITRGFLTGSEEELRQAQFLRASTHHHEVFASLTKNLKEAKFEHYVAGTENQYHLEAKLVNCMQGLSQNIGGLQSAAETQFLLLAEPKAAGGTSPESSFYSTPKLRTSLSFPSDLMTSPLDIRSPLAAIDEDVEEDRARTETSNHRRKLSGDSYLPTMKTPSDIFAKFIEHLGPSMKSLAFTLRQILDELPYGQGGNGRIIVNERFRSSLAEALKLYTNARQEALNFLYSSKDLNRARPMEVEADFEEVAASCGHFSFSLQDFANDMEEYLDILEDLKIEMDSRPNGRTWHWLKFWRRGRLISAITQHSGAESGDNLNDDSNESRPRGVSRSPTTTRNSGSSISLRKPQQNLPCSYRLWRSLAIFRRDDIKFAIKVGTGAALYALPSFLPATRPFYQHWRGEWGLLSYMLVCSMTIGASNTTGFARFLGTCIGAVCAIVSWVISQGNPFALAALGWLMALWTAYIILAQGKGPMGRFIMLTYNLSALYAYSYSARDLDDDDDEGGIDPVISEIVLHRVVAVLSGCLWGLIITRLIWPISARKKFKDGLSLLWLRMGLIWKRDPLSTLVDGESPSAYMDFREELELQRFMGRLNGLKNSAASEFDLRGPLPEAGYQRILKSTGLMLDAFHAMNVVIRKDLKPSRGEVEILNFTTEERLQLGSRISHLLQVLASSMKLEYPLNEALPSTDHARDRLLAKVFRFRRHSQVASGTSDADFALLYAFALVTGQLSKEIHDVGKEIENLFGVLDEDALKLQ